MDPQVNRYKRSTQLLDDMGVDNVGFLLNTLGADAPPLQYLRELVQNEIEAIERAGRDSGQIVIDSELVEGTSKLRISGNGVGMTPEEVAANINHLSASGGEQAFDKNFGVGAKIAAGTRNPHGVMYKAWKDGEGSLTILARVEGRYGRLGFLSDDGGVDYWLPLKEDQRHPVIDSSGVSVVLLGESKDDDTTVAPPTAELPSQWVSAYLERRYFELPTGVRMRVLRPTAIFDSKRGKKREIYDTIRGQSYYLDKHSDYSGVESLPGANASVWWWVLSEDITKGGKTWSNRGHMAALYQNELYEIRGGSSRASALKDFGIYAGFPRIVMYVEPECVLKANTPRTGLILCDGHSIDYATIGAAFADNLPDALAAFMAGQVTAERGDHRTAIRKNISKVEQELKQSRYRRSASADPDHFEPHDGGSPSRGDRVPREVSRQYRRSAPNDASGRVGADYLQKARKATDEKTRATEVDADPTPRVVWDKDGTTVPVGRAATYAPQPHVVNASTTFDFYRDMIEWTSEEVRKRVTGEAEGESIRSIAEDAVRYAFEQSLTDVVVVMRPLAHDVEWGPMVYKTGLSDEALTAAVVSHRWLMMESIRRQLSMKIAAPREPTVQG